MQTNENMEPIDQSTSAVTPTETAPQPVEVKKTALQALAEKHLEKVQELNPDFKIDFMNVFTRIKINTKGQFVYALSGEDFVLGDQIVTKLLAGEYMFQLWDSDENQLVCYSSDHVTNADGDRCVSCPHNEGQGTHPDCKIRYALVMNILTEGEEELFNINIPSTGAYAFADYVKLLAKKKMGVSNVLTTLKTDEKTSKADSSRKYNAVVFKLAEQA